jgi:hypothetical protein
MSRKFPRNELFLTRAKPLLSLIEDHVARIGDETKDLDAAYKKDRRIRYETVGKKPYHGNLSLYWKPDTLHEGLITFGRIYWKAGRYRDNKEDSRKLRKTPTPITRNIHRCGALGSYTRENFRHALRSPEKWELDLTMQYEKLAQELRLYLLEIHTIVDDLAWSRPFPDMPEGGPNAQGFDIQ